MKERLEAELEKIGLSEKEARVYLAGLELGPATAQTIAVKATVNRPTTYVMIESLVKRGLMSSFEKGKKRFFVAGEPVQLLHILKVRKKELEQQEASLHGLLTMMAEHEAKKGQKPSVQVYEGEEAAEVLREELEQAGTEILELLPAVVGAQGQTILAGGVRERLIKRNVVKTLAAASQSLPVGDGSERRVLPPGRWPLEAEMLVYGDRVIVAAVGGRPIYIHIRDQKIAATFRTLFLALWEQAAKR